MTKERLQKVIANRGYASRRAAEKLITSGRVKVDGIIITELGTKVDRNAKIEINNQEVISDSANQKYYYLFYKPRLVLTTMYDPKKRKTVADYFQDLPHRVYPIGRLDYDVSGLLIMTNDGEMSHFIMHPRYEFFKTYQAMCAGIVSKKQIAELVNGVIIDDNYLTKAIDAKLLKYDQEKNFSIIELTITEGRKHHVKKMLQAANLNLIKLKRTRIEFLEIGDLKPGQYRELKPNEVKKLYGIYKSIRQKDS
ncbi:pseudouridine synthase [Mycoplasma putrefaciens]|uniref:Ribosomal large subunit pseudouridine synthase B n=2 Tax=Mycoplasma putrefaciens TaxID=2123 RepID=M9W9H1_9MOLU|nr:pseudouridine synthase [Mycoplasma putrefaciens]AEM68758.1 pseudouridine synthase family protein [Mycoplasma putrefaciens KS1]AGJ90658.1 Ribosomal large subunit pseudouridine synthase B [Mycoplasma putrefaciens Mput9231]SYV96003.1 pseudouridine synthase family protein [Mycoplasma putrefaciens]